VSYENSSGKGAAKVGTVSGTSVAFGSEALFRDAVGGGTLTSFPGALSSTALVVAYTDDADSNHGTAKVSTYGPDPYPTVVSETKVAFCGWVKKPSG